MLSLDTQSGVNSWLWKWVVMFLRLSLLMASRKGWSCSVYSFFFHKWSEVKTTLPLKAVFHIRKAWTFESNILGTDSWLCHSQVCNFAFVGLKWGQWYLHFRKAFGIVCLVHSRCSINVNSFICYLLFHNQNQDIRKPSKIFMKWLFSATP